MNDMSSLTIKAIIGLGNPGSRFINNRHNIGFRVVDALAQRYNSQWRSREDMEIAEAFINETKILLIKPQTFMNDSGRVIPYLAKQGIKVENIVVVHDELEKPFGHISFRIGGSARGHNGLRSIISHCGPDFGRLRFGIGRPESKAMVSDYVLHNFSENQDEVNQLIDQSVDVLEKIIKEEE